MTKAEAAQVLEEYEGYIDSHDELNGGSTVFIHEAVKTAIAALIPTPDPDTGLMKCDYCNGSGEQKPLFHENNYEPHTCMQSYIEISESSYGKKPLICVDLWDGANACAAFEINYCPMCGRKLEEDNG